MSAAATTTTSSSAPQQESELVLRPDGRVYHINVKDDEVADYVLLVGDPARADQVASHFDTVEVNRANREFNVRTGLYHGVRVTVMSTGIGCDNIDIVVTELDAAVNYSAETRSLRTEPLRKLTLIRLGTCGALQADLDIDSTIVSAATLGMDGVAHFYDTTSAEDAMAQDFMTHVGNWPEKWNRPYARRASPNLLQHFGSLGTPGITITCNGFFGPQGRAIRLPLAMPDMQERFRSFTTSNNTSDGNDGTNTVAASSSSSSSSSLRVTNFEMECSALYALGQGLGHDTLTMCIVLANRYAGTFSKDYPKAVDRLIVNTLDRIVTMSEAATKTK